VDGVGDAPKPDGRPPSWLANAERSICCRYEHVSAASGDWRTDAACLHELAPGLRKGVAPQGLFADELVERTASIHLLLPANDLPGEFDAEQQQWLEAYANDCVRYSLDPPLIRAAVAPNSSTREAASARRWGRRVQQFLEQRGVPATLAPDTVMLEHISTIRGKVEMHLSTPWLLPYSYGHGPCDSGVTLVARLARTSQRLDVRVCRNGVCSRASVDPGGAGRANAILFQLRGALEATALLTLRGTVPHGPAYARITSPLSNDQHITLEVRAAYADFRTQPSGNSPPGSALVDGDVYSLEITTESGTRVLDSEQSARYVASPHADKRCNAAVLSVDAL
jgi:hypothetical protein